MPKRTIKMFVVVHAGVGTFSQPLEDVCAKAVRMANGNIVDAIKALEDNELTNCGFGSNLTMDGRVECEASFCISREFVFGAVGAVSRIRNPILVASKIVEEQLEVGDRMLIPPSVLVAEGAEEFARSRGIELYEPKSLISKRSLSNWRKARKILDTSRVDNRMDTVGAISIDSNGICKAGCSSGGVMLKMNGRLGHCVHIGAAIWSEQRNDRSVAVSLSGCGELIAKTSLAQRIASALLAWNGECSPLVECVRSVFENDFVNSPFLSSQPKSRILAGGIVLLADRDEGVAELIAFHNTDHLAFAYSDGKSVKKFRSCRPPEAPFVIQSFPFSYRPEC